MQERGNARITRKEGPINQVAKIDVLIITEKIKSIRKVSQELK